MGIQMYLFTALAVGVFYFYRKMNFWRRRGIPQHTQWTLLGDLWDVGLKYHYTQKLTSMYRKFKGKTPFFGFYTLTNPSAVITDPDVLRKILVKDFSSFSNRGLFHSEENDVLTTHMFNIEDEKWRQMRTSLSPTFTSGKMKSMFFIIEEKTKDFLRYLELKSARGSIDTKEASSRFTIDVVSSTSFGLESRALSTDQPEILDIVKEFTETSPVFAIYFFILAGFPKFAEKMGMRQFSPRLEAFFTKTILDAMEYRQKHGVKRADFLNMLMNLKERGTISDSGEGDPSRRFSFKECLAQAFIFFAGGFDTSSTVLNFALYFIAKHQEVQTKLRQEVEEAKQRHGGVVDYEAVMEMTYLTQVFNETLRHFSPVPILGRTANTDYRIEGTSYVIPKGTLVQVPIYSLHSDPEYWERPNDFYPEHFSAEQVAKRNPYVYLPFGEGPRNCIGMRFGQLQSKYAIAKVVENFRLTVGDRTQEPIVMDKNTGSTLAKGGLWVDFKKL